MTTTSASAPMEQSSHRVEQDLLGCGVADSSCCFPSNAMPWLRLVIGVFVAAQTMTLGLTVNLTPPDDHHTLLLLQSGMLGATALVILLLGSPLATEAARQLRGRRLTMEPLFLAGIGAAMAISVQSMWTATGPVYFEVVNVLLVVYSVGHTINARSRQRALAAMQAFNRHVATARRVDPATGLDRPVDVAEVQLGDRIRVFPGETVPVDGVIVSGMAMVRQTPFTGEWMSAVRRGGDVVLAGTGCEDGTLLIAATVAGTHRRIDELTGLIEKARSSPTSLQRQADRFVRWFLPAVLGVAVATLAYWTMADNWHVGLFNAMAVVLVACPCAAGLATPLAIWSVLGQLVERGLVLRSGDAVERLASIDGVIFDKTGTLSEDLLAVREILTPDDPATRTQTLAIIAAIERQSTHPVAKALRCLSPANQALAIQVRSVRILPGRGIEADVVAGDQGGLCASGNTAAASVQCVRLERDDAASQAGTLALEVTIDGRWAATLILCERLRDSAAAAIRTLEDHGLSVRVMTGDSAANPATTHLADTRSGMTPEQKHQVVLALREDRRHRFRRPLFVGDGLNDAAAMAASHVSIALASGAQIAVETASATLHGSDLTAIPAAIALCRRAVHTVRSNLRWAVLYNLIGIVAAATGYLHPVVASVLMACSSAVVGWRSFHLMSADTPIAPAVPSPEIRGVAPGSSRWWRRLSHWIGILGQVAILTQLAALTVPQGAGVLLVTAILTYLVLRAWRRLPAWADMTWAMCTIGGLGMNLGWWIDQEFSSAVDRGQVMSCCSHAMKASVSSSSHWMYWGMLLAGVPAMYLLRRTPQVFSLRRWCCVGPLLAGIPAMCFGMWAGAQLASHMRWLGPQTQVLASYVLMMLGMSAGMLAAHSLELVFPSAGPLPAPAAPARTS